MYSFAVILWELATGKVPFAGLSPMHVGIKVRSKLLYTEEGLGCGGGGGVYAGRGDYYTCVEIFDT